MRLTRMGMVAADSKDEAAAGARKRLQAVLDKLNPAAGAPKSRAAARKPEGQEPQLGERT